MTKRGVAWLLAAHAALVWLAVPLRIDEFPLTWAPMYAIQPTEAPGQRSVVLRDLVALDREGWLAVRADGGTERVTRTELNVTRRSMWRLYYERTWGKAPPRFKHKNSGGATLDRWLLGLPPGAPIFVGDWQRALLVSVNETLGRAPGAPDFFVTLHAERSVMHFDARTFARLPDTHETVVARWRPEWDAAGGR